MAQEYIELEDFDREYGLAELFQADHAKELFGEIEGWLHAAILLTDGSPHYSPSSTDLRSRLDAGIAAEIGKRGYAVVTDSQGKTAFFSLTHELETIGYLALEAQEKVMDDDLLRTGRFSVKAIQRIMHLNYKNRLTAGLHGRVVEDSYVALKEKNAQLRQSEEKYRKLAESLEVEVARQTEEIKSAQLILLQQEKLASVGQLAAGMAHEINNPMGFIISNLNSLRTYAADSGGLIERYRRLKVPMARDCDEQGILEEIRSALESIHEAGDTLDIDFVLEDMDALIAESLDGAERVKTIIHNLREFARPSIETMENADIHRCLDTTLALLTAEIGKDVRIQKAYGFVPPIKCRLREINQVFFHILRNALQSVGNRGDITIRTGTFDERTIEIAIRDTGTGIAASALPHLFEPFFTTREVGAGTGLGLNLAYNLIKKHEGTITVQSEEGIGSEFAIRIPIGGPDAASGAENH